MLRRGSPTARRAGVAVGGAAAVVAVQLGVVLLSLRLSARAVDGELPEAVVWLPLWAFSLGLVWLAMVFQRDASTRLEWFGPLLVAAAPFTAFGGGCGTLVGTPAVALHWSGVRLAVGSGGCSTHLNGVVLGVGAALLALGLWVSLGEPV